VDQIHGLTKTIRRVSIFLLLLNALNAIVGGWLLMSSPTGETLGISIISLAHSPFQNFLIPGLILFVANGVFSLTTATWTFFKWRNYARLIFFQGVILTGWIIIQSILMQTANLLHIFFGSIGILLVVFAIVLEEVPSAKQMTRSRKDVL
jgi:hypothetical protein